MPAKRVAVRSTLRKRAANQPIKVKILLLPEDLARRHRLMGMRCARQKLAALVLDKQHQGARLFEKVGLYAAQMTLMRIRSITHFQIG